MPAIHILFLLTTSSFAATNTLADQFDTTVRPYITQYCIGCHSGITPAAQFDLKAYNSLLMVTRDYPRWNLVMERLHAKDMPPKPVPAPPAAETQKVIAWIEAVRAQEIRKSAGDPGIVPARRLSNAEYNYTIRDLTGHNLNVTREFPIDPANPAGFDNSAESLTMSPSLLNKYLQAARDIASHTVFLPSRLDFAPHPMLVETDREKLTVQRIMDFYRRQPTKLAAYFSAAWQYRHRDKLGKPSATLATIARDAKLSPKYLPMVWQILNEPKPLGPIQKLQNMFQALPAEPAGLAKACQQMEDFVVRIRLHTGMQFAAPVVAGIPEGSQPLLHWKNLEFARNRRHSDPQSLRNDTDPPPVVPAIPKYPGLHRESAPRWAALMAKARAADEVLIVPAARRKEYEAAFERFANVFPDKFLVTERGRYFPDDSQDKGRLLSAGYHSVLGFFRDDQPLVELILDDAAKQELDRLWLEFDYVANATARTWTQYFFNQSGEVQGKGAESASPRPVGREIWEQSVILEMRDAYLAKAAAKPTNSPDAAKAIQFHYDDINATLRNIEKLRLAAEPKHLDSLLNFAARAYRRPPTKEEAAGITAYYRKLRDANQLSHEDAIRESLVSVLMSPHFLYRVDLRTAAPATSAPVVALTPTALASRLSYFLWSSMPDDELLKHAAGGDLTRRDVLLAQTRRMLKDPRVSGFATEFAGNWLGVRHFERNNSVDRQRFPAFTNELREAMFLEPIRFLQNIVTDNASILDLLYGDYTYVNPVLAKHYEIPGITGDANAWVRVDNAQQYGRGGLLPMAVFLTQNSPGLRTSPVKRGAWVVQRVLGEVIPPPPPVVPELPHDEAASDLPVRQLLAKHREVPLCAACHARIDPFGLPFESYGPVGNRRDKDLAGRPVDTAASYPGGFTAEGLNGLQTYIRDHRQKLFVANISRKLLAYALNRSLQLSDEPVIERMQAAATANGYKFSTLVETIITSPQFLNKRVREAKQ